MKPKENYDGKDLRKYLEWVHEHRPRIKEDVEENWGDLMKIYITQSDENKPVRHDQGIIRVSFAIAKLYHRDAKVKDMVEAIILVDPGFKENLETLEDTGMINGWLKEPLNNMLGKYNDED